ncbi:hypothetical protein PABG_03195 [Paracoccidioides brasiliensis Pb03]|nr:hypothetical protein PABG_03195 [Paracoccidioides brasiliensis Pb03]
MAILVGISHKRLQAVLSTQGGATTGSGLRWTVFLQTFKLNSSIKTNSCLTFQGVHICRNPTPEVNRWVMPLDVVIRGFACSASTASPSQTLYAMQFATGNSIKATAERQRHTRVNWLRPGQCQLISNINNTVTAGFWRGMELPNELRSGPGVTTTPSATITFGPFLTPAASATFASTLVTSISTPNMDNINVLAMLSRGAGPEMTIGSCTWPTDQTTVTDSNHRTTVYAQLVCGDSGNRDCCFFGGTSTTPLRTCPEGYTTTGETACCPLGWSIFSTLLGTQIPCYSQVSTATPLSTTPSGEVSVVTIHTALFATKYDLFASETTKPSASPASLVGTTSSTSSAVFKPLEKSPASSRRLTDRAIAGVVIGSVFGAVLLLGIVLILLRQWKSRNSDPAITVDDLIRQPAIGVHELGTTDHQHPYMQPRDDAWMTRTTSTIPLNDIGFYLSTTHSTEIAPTIRAIEPQELPGNMFINEYHPAYRNDPESWET